jgi:hypothetical protein
MIFKLSLVHMSINAYIFNVELIGLSQIEPIHVTNIHIMFLPWLGHLENFSDWETQLESNNLNSNSGSHREALVDLS